MFGSKRRYALTCRYASVSCNCNVYKEPFIPGECYITATIFSDYTTNRNSQNYKTNLLGFLLFLTTIDNQENNNNNNNNHPNHNNKNDYSNSCWRKKNCISCISNCITNSSIVTNLLYSSLMDWLGVGLTLGLGLTLGSGLWMGLWLGKSYLVTLHNRIEIKTIISCSLALTGWFGRYD